MDIKKLIAVATGEIRHANAGMCPDMVSGYDSRDPDCLACQIIIEAEHEAQAARGRGPVAAQCKFKDQTEWMSCAVEHHQLVQANPEEWKGYETRALFAYPLQAEPVSAQLLEATIPSSVCKERPAHEDALAAIASAEAQQAEPNGSLTLDKNEVHFLAARLRRLFAKFEVSMPDQDDSFIVGVAGSLIGNLLFKVEAQEQAEPVRLSDKECAMATTDYAHIQSDHMLGIARAIEVGVLRANGLLLSEDAGAVIASGGAQPAPELVEGAPCRNALWRNGKPFPKSSCQRCGTLLRPGWKCADGVEV